MATTSSAIQRRVRAFVSEHDIFEPGPVVVACSGGPDSLALVGILHALARDLGLVVHVAHFDHRMRAGSERDGRVVERVARELGLPTSLGAAARAPRGEAEAREARYRFLRGIAHEIGAKSIALGHTRDDQAETVLLHLARGTGVVGLAAMRPRREDLARPLLCLRRAETRGYVRAMRIRPALDPSNQSERYARNLVRLRVLPVLERVNPKVVEALGRVADNAALLADVLRDIAARALDGAATVREGRLAIDLERLPSADAIASEALALAAERSGAGSLSERHRHALLALARGEEGSARVDLPHGVVALREYRTLVVGPPARAAVAPADTRLETGRVIAWDGWLFALGDGRTERTLPLRVRLPPGELIVRAWRPGDRLAGAGKVQDVLTDAKVPRSARRTYPVVVTPTGDVLWVPGLARAAIEAKETEVTLAARPPGPVPA